MNRYRAFLWVAVVCCTLVSCGKRVELGYVPQEGDLVFQSLQYSALVNAIEGITSSPYSHCGVVTKVGQEWYVIEAIGPVKETPLKTFIAQGRHYQIDVFRLKEDYREGIDGFIAHLRSYKGKPYDLRYRMDDSKIYCSELIYKAFEKQYGEKLGEIRKLGEMNWKPYESTIVHYERGPVPLEREMITPRAVAESNQVEMVYDGSEDKALK